MNTSVTWRPVCALDEIVPDTGVAALLDGRQIAVFRMRADDRVYAISNRDPFSGSNVLARGLIGDLQGERVVARSEEHTSELQSLMRISYAVFCLKKKK